MAAGLLLRLFSDTLRFPLNAVAHSLGSSPLAALPVFHRLSDWTTMRRSLKRRCVSIPIPGRAKVSVLYFSIIIVSIIIVFYFPTFSFFMRLIRIGSDQIES